MSEKQVFVPGENSIMHNTQLSCVLPPTFSHFIFILNCYHLASLCLQVGRGRGRGRVVNLTSGLGHMGSLGHWERVVTLRDSPTGPAWGC